MTINLDVTVGIVTVAPNVTVTLTGAPYTAGDTVADVTWNLTGDTSGTPALDNGTVTVEIDGTQRPPGYVLSAGENIAVRFTATHVTGAIDVVSATSNVRAPGGNLSVATAITATRTSAFAPAGIIFSNDASDANKRALRFKWTYNQAGTYTLLDSARLAGRDKNTSYGPVGSVVFETPGTYDVTLEIHDGTDYQVLTRTITITSADAEFPATDTICIDAGSNWAGAPAGAQRVTSWAAALSALNANNGGRILFNRGDSYDIGNALVAMYGGNWNGRTAAHKIALGAYGPGSAKPVIDQTGGGFLSFNQLESAGNIIAISGLEFRGDYSATAGTGTITTGQSGRPDGIAIGSGTNSGHYTIHDCKFSKLSQCISNVQDTSPNLNIVVSEVFITEWEDYGIWCTKANIAVVGSSVKQHIAAVNGTEAKQLGSPVNYPDHGPMRFSDNLLTCVANNDLFSRNGWSSQGKGWQPCIRMNTKGFTGDDVTVSGNQCEGSGVGLITNTSQSGASTNEVATAWVIEKNHLIGSTASYRMFAIGKGNTVIRNNIVVMPDVAPLPSWNQMRKFVDLAPDGPVSTASRNAEVLIENNAMIDLRSSANQSTDSDIVASADISSRGWTAITTRSNIYHAPNRSSPTNVSNLNTTDVFAPLCDGHRFDTSTPTTPTPSGVGSTGSYKPATGSGAIGNTTAANCAVDDFDGNIRNARVAGLTRTTYSDGPFEPALES